MAPLSGPARCLTAVPGLTGDNGVMFLVPRSLAAFPGPAFPLGADPGACGSAGDRLRLRCFGGNLPSAPS